MTTTTEPAGHTLVHHTRRGSTVNFVNIMGDERISLFDAEHTAGLFKGLNEAMRKANLDSPYELSTIRGHWWAGEAERIVKAMSVPCEPDDD